MGNKTSLVHIFHKKIQFGGTSSLSPISQCFTIRQVHYYGWGGCILIPESGKKLIIKHCNIDPVTKFTVKHLAGLNISCNVRPSSIYHPGHGSSGRAFPSSSGWHENVLMIESLEVLNTDDEIQSLLHDSIDIRSEPHIASFKKT